MKFRAWIQLRGIRGPSKKTRENIAQWEYHTIAYALGSWSLQDWYDLWRFRGLIVDRRRVERRQR